MKEKKSFKFTKNIYLKLVSLKDAKLIYDLRTDKKLSKYLNPTSSKINDQIKWMKNYFKRNNKKLEYYFKFRIKKKNKFIDIGVARVIKLSKNNFSFGSWIMKPNLPSWVALECALSIYEFSFMIKKFKKNLMWMDLRNKKVIIFHKYMGAIETRRDENQLYAYISVSKYIQIKNKFLFFFVKKINNNF